MFLVKIDTLRNTSDNKLAGGIRLYLAMLFLMTGAMKLLVPSLGAAFSGQLLAAHIPLYALSIWAVPFIEIAAGIALGAGAFTRLASVVVLGIMFVATYVHLVVEDPALFPLQMRAPVMPLTVIAMCAYLLWRGGGSWSRDLKASKRKALSAGP